MSHMITSLLAELELILKTKHKLSSQNKDFASFHFNASIIILVGPCEPL